MRRKQNNFPLTPLKDNGKLEIHVPTKFSTEQPALTYTHECLTEMSISDHPIAKQLPRYGAGVPSIQPMPKFCDFRTLQVRKDFPTSLDAIIEAGLPQLSLHIHSFNDATVVGFAWPHTLMDGIARAGMMRSWSLVMAGQEDKVPRIAGARQDVLFDMKTHDTTDQDDFFAEKRLLKGIRLARFIYRWGWDKLTAPPKVWRAMYLPRVKYDMLVDRIKSQVLQMGLDLDKKLFVSEVDALTAWITQKVALMEPKPRPVTIMSLFNCRYRLEKLHHSESIYAQNTVLMSYTLLSPQEARGAVAPLAISHREQVVKQTTESRVVSFVQWLRKEIEKGNHKLPLCGETDSVVIFLNPLTKADLIKVADFGPAVVRLGENEKARSNPPGTMLNFFYKTVHEPMPCVNSFTILGKDHDGGAWCSGYLSAQVWEAVDQDLKSLTEEC